MTRLPPKALVLAVLVVTAAPTAPTAAAQDLYSMGGVEWETIPGTTTVSPVGIDQAGAVYEDLNGSSETKTPFSCYDPSEPEGTAAKPEVEQGGYRVAMTHDQSAIAAFRYSPSPVQLHLCQCAGGGSCEKQWEFPTVLPNLGEHEVDKLPGRMVMAPDGVPCFVTFEGLNCAVPNPGQNKVEWKLRIDLAWLDANLPMDPGLSWQATGPATLLSDVKSRWDLRSVVWRPDGRMFALVAVQYWTSWAPSDWLPCIIEQLEDGTAKMVMRPQRPPVPGKKWYYGDRHTQLYNPLDYATQLLYEPTLGALVAWPVGLMEYNHTPMYDPQQMIDYAAGSGGLGLYVIPLEGVETEYLSLLHGRVDGMSRAPQSHFLALQAPDGSLVFPVEKVEAGLLHKLTLDLDRLDMDNDGLPYNLEEELGTSDYTIETDRGTTIDPIEALVTGTDPSSIADDPAPIRNERLIYVESAMIRGLFSRLGIEDQVRNGLIPGTSGAGPLCFVNEDGMVECIHADRVTRSYFPYPGASYTRFSHDGTFVLVRTDEGISRVQLDNGHTEKVLEWGAVLQVCGAETLDSVTLDFYPAGEDLTFVTCYQSHQEGDQAWDEYFVVAFRQGEEGKLLYDHQKARCDSGLGLCDPSLAEWKEVKDGTPGKLYPHDLLFGAVGSAGYVPEIDRLLMTVAGSWGRYYVGLSPDHEPAVLVGPKYLQGGMRTDYMANKVQPTGYGDYYTGWGFMDGWLNNRADAWIQFTSPPAMFWNGFSVSVDPDGSMWENVRYEGTGEPGDVLLLAQKEMGSMIYRSGPRGGLAHAWDEPYPFYSPFSPWGIDMSQDGLLCIAHRRGWYNSGAVSILESDAPWAVPAGQIMEVGELGDVTDCHWGEDGSLYWLNADPPRIERLPEMWVEKAEIVEELPEGSVPIDLVVTPEGEFEYLDANGPLRGLYYLSDGRRISVSANDFVVRIDNEPSVNLNQIIYGVYGVPVGDSAHTFIRFQERADGLVVAVPFGCQAPLPIGGTAFIFDPDTSELWQLSSSPLVPLAGNGLALMPGGVDADPWGPGGAADAPVGPEGPAPIESPMYGYPLTREAGCSGGPRSATGFPGLACLLAALVLLVAVRRWSMVDGRWLALRSLGEVGSPHRNRVFASSGMSGKRGASSVATWCMAVASIALLGCGGGVGEEGGPGVTGGEGPTNEESLMPLEIGTRWVVKNGDSVYHVVVAEGGKKDGKEWRRQEWSDGRMALWVHSGGGWSLAQDETASVDTPLLSMPDKVRVGMTWNAGTTALTVLSRGLQATPWGERMTWEIASSGPGGDSTSLYVEGRGWWKDVGGNREVLAAFMPLEPQASAPSPKKTKLQPVEGPEGGQLVLELEGGPLYGVEDEAGSAVMGIRGLSWDFLGGAWGLNYHHECIRVDDSSVQTLTANPGAAAYQAETDGLCFGPEQGHGFDHYEVAPWISSDGQDYFYLEPELDWIDRTDFRFLVAPEGEKSPLLVQCYKGYGNEAEWGITAFDKMPQLPCTFDPVDALTHFDVRPKLGFAPMRASGPTLPLGLFTKSGLLVAAEWVMGEEVAQPMPLLHAGFSPTVSSTRQGRTALMAGHGYVDEVSWEDGDAVVRRLAAFDLPENHFVTGAARQGERLIVVTGNRVEGANVANGLDARKAYFWGVHSVPGTGEVLAPPRSLAVGAMVSGVDVVVCWPHTDELLDPEGWKLGGAPAVRVSSAFEEGNCALAVRDASLAADVGLDGGRLLEADIPGVGRMEIVVPPGGTLFRGDIIKDLNWAPNEVWPMPDGGLVGLGKSYDPNGLPLRAGQTGLDQWNGTQDGAGNGFWRMAGDRVELCTGGGGSVLSKMSWPNPNGPAYPIHKIVGTSAKGGAIVAAIDGGQWKIWLVAPDGTVTALPPTPEQSPSSAAISGTGGYCAMLYPIGLSCIDKEGVLHPVAMSEPPMGGAKIRPFHGGELLVTATHGQKAWTITPETLALQPYGEGTPMQGYYSHGTDGKLYLLPLEEFQSAYSGYTGKAGPTSIPYELTPDGPVPVPLPDPSARADFQQFIRAFIPAAEYSLVVFNDGHFLRLPR